MKLSLVGFAMVVTACNGSKAAPKDEAKGPVKITEATTAERAATAEAKATSVEKAQPATNVDAGKCGDGKITLDASSARETSEVIVFCRDGKPMVQNKLEYRGESEGTNKRALTIEQWNQVWAMADTAKWQTAVPACKEVEDEVITTSLTIHRDSVTKKHECRGEWAWGTLAGAVDELGTGADFDFATTITAWTFGPVAGDSVASIASLSAAIPGAWTEDTGDYSKIFTHPDGVNLYAEDDGKVVAGSVTATTYKTVKGIHVDSTGEALAAAYSDTSCTTNVEDANRLECVSSSEPGVTFHFDISHAKGKAGGIPVKKLATATIKEIGWAYTPNTK